MNGNELTYYFKNGKIKAEVQFINDLTDGEWMFYLETFENNKIAKANNK